MADSTLDDALFVLQDNWPGAAERLTVDSIPGGTITAAAYHDVATPAAEPGRKIEVWVPSALGGPTGFSRFIYLKGLAVTEANPSPAAKQLVVPCNTADLYQVTNDKAQCILAAGCGLAAVLLSAMSFDNSTAYYGWFWCGGVCPTGLVAALDGNFATEGNVFAGAPITAHALAADAIGLGPVSAGEATIGHTLSADA
jgi:hypothetical protein